MCKCVKKVTEMLLKEAKKRNTDRGEVKSGQLTHMGLSIQGNSGWRTYQVFEYEMTNIKKGGVRGATKKHTLDIYHTYCPFCGEKYPEE